MKIAIGADHRGFKLKEDIKQYLNENKIEVIDCGTNSEENTDYPNIASKVAIKVQNKECEEGILICGTGFGMCITANKYKGIRSVPCYNEETAKLSKQHNNINILALGANQTTKEEALNIVKTWLETSFEGGRHEERIKLIENIEKENMK